jgi:hypothetical protein
MVQSPAEEKDLSARLCVQTSFEAHPASHPMGTKFLSPVVKYDQGMTPPTLISAKVKNE